MCAVLVLEDLIVVKTVMHHFDMMEQLMKTTYYHIEDTSVIHLSDKPIAHVVSQDWHTHLSYKT